MRRGNQGTLLRMRGGGEEYRVYVPNGLPPSPPILLDQRLQDLLERANRSLGRLDGLASVLPDLDLVLYFYVRKEAVLSSQIEGTQSSLSDLLLFEELRASQPSADVTEVSNYVAAMEHGLDRIRSGFPLSLRVLKEIHAILLRSGRGSEKEPGEFRRSQNWLGGTRPGNAAFVPAPHEEVTRLMGELELFLHDTPVRTPTLLKAALAHLQFETIHPFLDGNGRMGRLLVTLVLCAEGAIKDPLLYLSLYLKEQRATYYQLLDAVRAEGDWEAWLEFFLEGVVSTADEAAQTARSILELFESDRARLRAEGRAAGSLLRVHEHLQRHPVTTVAEMTRELGLSTPAVLRSVDRLHQTGLVIEITGKKRNRLFAYEAYMRLLSSGTESPLAS
ncbi:MAG: Fic family protein [Candidatus Dormibacteria bacterium]